GPSKTTPITLAMSRSPKTPTAAEPATPRPSWPCYATSCAARSASPAGPTPPAHDGPTPHRQPRSASTASHDHTDLPGTPRGPGVPLADLVHPHDPAVLPVSTGGLAARLFGALA